MLLRKKHSHFWSGRSLAVVPGGSNISDANALLYGKTSIRVGVFFLAKVAAAVLLLQMESACNGKNVLYATVIGDNW